MISIFEKLKKNKLTISFLLIIVMFVSLGLFTINGLNTLINLTRRIHQHPLVVSNASLHAALNIIKIQRNMRDIVLATSPGEIYAAIKAVNENEQKVYAQLDIIKRHILGQEGQNLEKQTRQLFTDWNLIRGEAVRLLETGHKREAILIIKEKGAEHVAKLEAKMMELASYARNKADSFMVLSETSHIRFRNIIIILTIAGILLSMAIAFIATRLVLKAEILLQDKNDQLQKALDEIKTLRGILPICSFCKNIRNDQGYYETIEKYIHKHSGVDFSHTICPSCLKKHYPEYME
jgi:hypothetical protein